ncbi:unnamed protein product [Caenorhabditis brenneri]
MAQAPIHPLLSLPDDEIVEKIREMNIIEIIEFSLISERTKNLVKSAKIQGTNVLLKITIFDFIVRFKLENHRCTLSFLNIQSTKSPLEVKISYDIGARFPIEKTIRRDLLRLEDWLKHFKTIFNFWHTDSIEYNDVFEDYDPVKIKEYFGVPTSLTVLTAGHSAHNQVILQTFLPVDSLTIEPSVFQNSEIPPKILIQNFKSLRSMAEIGPESITLDKLLMINSKTVVMRRARMCSKDIIRFIKLWQHGANPRMEYIFITYETDEKEEDEDDEETILKGIKYEEISRNVARPFRSAESINECVRGGIDIWRKDGVKATVHFDRYWKRFEMFIWFDHCIV